MLGLLVRVSAGPWQRKLRSVDRQIRRVGIGFVVLFGLLFVQLAYIQVFAADRIADNPANAARQIIAEYKIKRGTILTQEGVVLAQSVQAAEDSALRFDREYPQGALYGHITGYYSRIFGRSGLEAAMGEELSGDAPELAVANLPDLILGRPRRGASVVVTLDHELQLAAAEAFGSLPGAVAAIDPRNGDILALVSNPSFDPTELSVGSDRSIRRAWDRLNQAESRPLIARATDELFLPGSSFKIVTAAAALENGFGPDSVWPNPHRLDLPLTTNELQNFADAFCNFGSSTITLLQAFVESCNVTFGEVGPGGRRRGDGRASARLRVLCDDPSHEDRLRRADDPVRARVRARPVPGGGVLRRAGASARLQRRSAWTTTSRTR